MTPPNGADDRAVVGERSPEAQLERDAVLARRFAAGDTTVVRELYARWSGPIFSVALRRLRQRHLAEEALQETFVKAWRAAATFDTRRELGPWLSTIARNVAVDIARRESRRPSTTELSEAGPASATEGPTLSEAWEEWEVRCALRDLPGEERELVRLTHYVGLSQSQIADQLGMPLGTVKSRIHRAHRRLAGRLRHLRMPA